VRQACPALNTAKQPCGFWATQPDGRCVYHTTRGRIVPAIRNGVRIKQPIEVPEAGPVIYNAAHMPSLRAILGYMPRLKAWAAEFDELADERYTASEFMAWIELEHARPARPKPEPEVVYPVLVAVG
jgi:hypothetical protein